ncbi:hypothetical protein NKR23_g10548 [Pleurostoma richardsiae]|uniref:Uncharacterized protein n=1 Tax=Pleurostoma richardsiae TaxID=41990 RepID=A0AA38VLB4_9PEZI|nr:hypothetical protein NKR23_g10548 [Pleurostoma richardsiae]
MSFFHWRHIPALVEATGKSLGGLTPFFNPAGAIRAYGLPEHIAASPAAQVCIAIYGSRDTVLGLATWVFYLRGQLRAVDTIMALLLYTGAVDAYICWKQGQVGTAWFRGLIGTFFGIWGLMGLTARRT